MTLYINACVRACSRTDRIARALLQALGGDCEELKLSEEAPEPLSEERLQLRTELIEPPIRCSVSQGSFSRRTSS